MGGGGVRHNVGDVEAGADHLPSPSVWDPRSAGTLTVRVAGPVRQLGTS